MHSNIVPGTYVVRVIFLVLAYSHSQLNQRYFCVWSKSRSIHSWCGAWEWRWGGYLCSYSPIPAIVGAASDWKAPRPGRKDVRHHPYQAPGGYY